MPLARGTFYYQFIRNYPPVKVSRTGCLDEWFVAGLKPYLGIWKTPKYHF